VSPGFDSLDWIGIYNIGDAPGGPASVTWDYILPQDSGTIYLDAPDDAGMYKAFLLCCDGYDTIAISSEFQVAIPELTCSSSIYTEGDSMVFSYVSPRFSPTDWIGIYPTGTKPGSENPSIDWDYIPDSAGVMTFKTALTPGVYDAYLLCCDGYDSISACTFEVVSSNTAYVTPVSSSFAAGVPIDIQYNDPSYAEGDWIGIYFEGDDPELVSSVAWQNVTSQSGTVSFPGTLSGGSYFAVLFCCGSSETKYAESSVFTVEAGASGTYIKTAASVYPEGVNILVNYRTTDLQENDWIGIYNKGDAPGGPSSIDWQYITADSGTVEFTTELSAGDYVVYLLCCDGYQIKAKYNFQVADASTPTIVAGSMTFAANDSLVFHYNSPSWVDTDWIGIYNPEDVPGDIGSITWEYLPETSGTLTFAPEDHGLAPGEYWAGLFCCDGYDLYAMVSFIVTDTTATAINTLRESAEINVYPNPSDGFVSVNMKKGESFHGIVVYDLVGKVVYQERFAARVEERTFDLRFLNRGIYIISVRSEKSHVTSKLIKQ
jgi:hypothetical protein